MEDLTGQSTQTVDQSTQTWLESYNQPPNKDTRNKRKVVILGAVVTTIVIAVVVGIFALQSSTSCLTAIDLNSLTTTQTNEKIDSKENFYTFNVAFTPTTTTYLEKTETSGVTVQSLANFLNMQSNKIYVVRITAVQPSNPEAPLIEERISKVKNDLLAGGVDEKSIIVSNAVNIPPEELEETDSFDGYVIVSVSSSEQCR